MLNMLRSIALNNPTVRKSLPELVPSVSRCLRRKTNPLHSGRPVFGCAGLATTSRVRKKDLKALLAAQPADDLALLNLRAYASGAEEDREARKALELIQIARRKFLRAGCPVSASPWRSRQKIRPEPERSSCNSKASASTNTNSAKTRAGTDPHGASPEEAAQAGERRSPRRGIR